MRNISRIFSQNFKSIGAKVKKLWAFEGPLLRAVFLYLPLLEETRKRPTTVKKGEFRGDKHKKMLWIFWMKAPCCMDLVSTILCEYKRTIDFHFEIFSV